MKIGYARVSTQEQNLDLQIDALTAHGCEKIYQEHKSGKNTERLELESCLKALRAGDLLCVNKLDRLGRNLADLIRIVSDLEKQGIGFVSLSENIDTSTPSGVLTLHIFSALSEYERSLIRERTNAGISAARDRGRIGGRPSKLTGKNLAMAKELMANKDNDVSEIARRFGVSRATLYRLTASSRITSTNWNNKK
jgi:DNA invertase Pin-like site-specific DNA recombinase